MAKILF